MVAAAALAAALLVGSASALPQAAKHNVLFGTLVALPQRCLAVRHLIRSASLAYRPLFLGFGLIFGEKWQC